MLQKLLITFAMLGALAVLPVLAQTTPAAPPAAPAAVAPPATPAAVAPPAAPAAVAPPALIGGTVLPGVGTAIETGPAADKLTFLRETFITSFISTFLKWTAALAVTFLVVGAYQYLTAVGNDEQIQQAHKTIMWSLIGLVLALLAFAIVQIVVSIQFGAPPPA